MNCLVTGATGFLGKHLCAKLEELNYRVYVSNTKVANLFNLKNLDIYDDIKFDYIFHLAAVTKAGDYCINHKGDQWINNQIINTNILSYWKDKQPQAKMICMGTSCTYAPDIKLEEENCLFGQPESSLYTYAMTKRMLLVGLKALQHQYNLKWLYFIPSTLYGPGFKLEDNHFIFDFIRNCYLAKNKNQDFILWGDGYQKRELIYVDDAVNAMINLINYDNEVFNLGSGQDHSIRKFAKKVCEIYEYDFNLVKYDLSKYIGVREKSIDTSKVVEYLKENSYINTSLDTGLKKTINYFCQEMELR
tara:strand:+ start:645 stop:1556 length:912 start_codon:yes stop_codon:yes gene_type:complete